MKNLNLITEKKPSKGQKILYVVNIGLNDATYLEYDEEDEIGWATLTNGHTDCFDEWKPNYTYDRIQMEKAGQLTMGLE